jgi:hypothetical protein
MHDFDSGGKIVEQKGVANIFATDRSPRRTAGRITGGGAASQGLFAASLQLLRRWRSPPGHYVAENRR